MRLHRDFAMWLWGIRGYRLARHWPRVESWLYRQGIPNKLARADFKKRDLIQQRGDVTRHCCYPDCGAEAEFGIYGAPAHPDDATETCEQHVGALLGTPTWKLGENTHWLVYPIQQQEGT